MPDRLVALLLQEWREAERERLALPPDASAEARATAQRRVDTLRTAYHEAHRVLGELHDRSTTAPRVSLHQASEADLAKAFAYTGMAARNDTEDSEIADATAESEAESAHRDRANA